MSNEKVLVLFTQSWRGYSKGEKARFDAAQATALVDGKVAELVKGGKGAAKPSTDKGGGQGGAAKASSGEASQEAGSTDQAPAAADPASADAESGADDEPKP